MQVDAPELGQARRRQRGPPVRLPDRLYAVGLEDGGHPGRSESADWFASFVAEHERVIRLLRSVGLELQPFKHPSQSHSCDRDEPRLLTFRCLAAEGDEASRV